LGNPWTEWRLIVGNIIYKLRFVMVCPSMGYWQNQDWSDLWANYIDFIGRP
jgi:hypothetical protein